MSAFTSLYLRMTIFLSQLGLTGPAEPSHRHTTTRNREGLHTGVLITSKVFATDLCVIHTAEQHHDN
jgi:hypothetical protein